MIVNFYHSITSQSHRLQYLSETGICYSFCLTEFLPMFGESDLLKRGGKQVPSSITAADNVRYSLFHPPSQHKHDQWSTFHQSDTSTLDFDSGSNDAKDQEPCESFSLQSKLYHWITPLIWESLSGSRSRYKQDQLPGETAPLENWLLGGFLTRESSVLCQLCNIKSSGWLLRRTNYVSDERSLGTRVLGFSVSALLMFGVG